MALCKALAYCTTLKNCYGSKVNAKQTHTHTHTLLKKANTLYANNQFLIFNIFHKFVKDGGRDATSIDYFRLFWKLSAKADDNNADNGGEKLVKVILCCFRLSFGCGSAIFLSSCLCNAITARLIASKVACRIFSSSKTFLATDFHCDSGFNANVARF